MTTRVIPQGSLRITATLPRALHINLTRRADYEGCSLSNLIAFLLEYAMQDYKEPSC